jgi:hypothetical protein
MEALLHAIRERSKEDPLVGAKVGSKEVLQRLVDAAKDERGVHVESLLCILGALAGYACQANLRAQALSRGMPETAAFQTVEARDGKKYFFGDPLNDALAGSKYSVWGLAAGAAQNAGAKGLPDINEMFQHTSSVLGGPKFGVPRLPEGHATGDSPVNYLKALWPAVFPMVKLFCPNPVDWPILFSLAIQEVILMGKATIAPELSLTIVMESAIPMSKIDLANP